jgi:5-methylcytosine-specific restriction endonuclease McrA
VRYVQDFSAHQVLEDGLQLLVSRRECGTSGRTHKAAGQAQASQQVTEMLRPCLICGTPAQTADGRCPRHPIVRQHRRTTAQRGYDAEYKRNREKMIELAWIFHLPCVLCGSGFASESDITAEHIIPRREGGTSAADNLGPAHKRCNSARLPVLGSRSQRSAPEQNDQNAEKGPADVAEPFF